MDELVDVVLDEDVVVETPEVVVMPAVEGGNDEEVVVVLARVVGGVDVELAPERAQPAGVATTASAAIVARTSVNEMGARGNRLRLLRASVLTALPICLGLAVSMPSHVSWATLAEIPLLRHRQVGEMVKG